MEVISNQQFKFTKPNGREAAIRKEYTSLIKQVGSEEDRSLSFTISTDSVDRHGDTVSATGWQTANFMRNPVVLFAHAYDSLPVGKAVSLTPMPHGLRSTVQFASAAMNPFAEQVFLLCKGGFLNACSVGFIPLEYEEAYDRTGTYPMNITKQELLEFSIVPVPANGEALMARAAMLGMSKAAFKAKFTRSGTHAGGDAVGDLMTTLGRIERTLGITAPNPAREVTAEELNIVVNALIDEQLNDHSNDELDISEAQLEEVLEKALDNVFGVDMTRKRSETDQQWGYRTSGGARLKVQ